MDGLQKVAVKGRKSPSEFLAFETCQEKMEKILSELTQGADDAAEGEGEDVGKPAGGAGAVPLEDDLQEVVGAEQVMKQLESHGLDDMLQEKYSTMASRHVDRFVKLLSHEDFESESELAALLKATSAVTGSGRAGLLFDPKLGGESRTSPHVRCAPFSEETCTKIVSAFTVARGGSDAMSGKIFPNDVVFVMDAGKHGLSFGQGGFARVFRDDTSAKVKNFSKVYYLNYDEACVRARRRATRTCHGLQLMEMLCVYSGVHLTLTSRPRKILRDCTKTNSGNTIGLVRYELWKNSWKMTWAKKQDVFGDMFRVEVGGKTDADASAVNEDADAVLAGDEEANEAEEDGEKEEPVLEGLSQYQVNPGRSNKPTRNPDTKEVVFLHALNQSFYEELVHSFELKSMVDATAGPGLAAMACMEAGINYTGVCFTKFHCQQLRAHLISKTFEKMQDSGSKFYCPDLSVAMDVDDHGEPEEEKKPRKRKPKGKAKPKAKKKPKKNQEEENVEDQADDNEDLGEPDEEESDEGHLSG